MPILSNIRISNGVAIWRIQEEEDCASDDFGFIVEATENTRDEGQIFSMVTSTCDHGLITESVE